MAFRRRGSNAGRVSDVVICKLTLILRILVILFIQLRNVNNLIMTLMMDYDNYECSRKTKVLLSVE